MFTIKGMELFRLLMLNPKNSWSLRYQQACSYVEETLGLPKEENQRLRKSVRRHCGHVRRKWEECHRKEEAFFKKYEDWLNSTIIIPLPGASIPSTSQERDLMRGRPRKLFGESSDRSKRRKAKKIRTSFEGEEMTLATAMDLRSRGNEAAAKLLSKITTKSPGRASRILQTWKSSKTIQQRKYTAEEALLLIINNNLTKSQYIHMLKGAKEHGHDLYPSYFSVNQAKKEAYPEGISAAEKKFEVKLQVLLDHSSKRLCQLLTLEAENGEDQNYTLVCKWGFDGSSGHPLHKQRWSETGGSDESLFATSIVPLRLVHQATKEIIWSNPRPSSPRFCRPVRMQWISESKDVSKAEEKYITQQIDKLEPFVMGNIKISFIMCLTMVDGKVCNALTETSSMTCSICRAKISNMNLIEEMRNREIDTSAISFGLSVLHANIRFFECLLHIAYRLEFKKWKASKKDGTEALLLARKKKMQEAFLNILGLRVDMPKPGFGSSNDGNTARRFLNNSAESAKITGISEELIIKFSNILKAISSGYSINTEKFENYCWSAAKLYVQLYPWYHMPPTGHKILIHGAVVVREAILPIGQLTEEALESRHKDFKRFRRDHSRKSSRIASNTDVFHRLLLTSDPLISSKRELPRQKQRNLPVAVREMLDDFILSEESDDEFNDGSEDEEETDSSSDE